MSCYIVQPISYSNAFSACRYFSWRWKLKLCALSNYNWLFFFVIFLLDKAKLQLHLVTQSNNSVCHVGYSNIISALHYLSWWCITYIWCSWSKNFLTDPCCYFWYISCAGELVFDLLFCQYLNIEYSSFVVSKYSSKMVCVVYM